MSKSNFYVTSPIYYVNDKPHIGHAYTSIACDILARFKRLDNNNVFFLTGTDEHGQKVEKSAIKNNKTPQQFCDEVSVAFRDLTSAINLSNNDFIRTTEERHQKTAQIFWAKLEEAGFIYKDVYEGWYSVRDEAFYSADEIIDNKAPSGAEVEWHKEESYFFKLSQFGDKLLEFYEKNPNFIEPKSRFNEVKSFVKSGLRDLSISRTSFNWGVKVPNDEKHIMYVWLDALTNYLSALDFASEEQKNYEDFWLKAEDSPVHIVGKDIVRFHGIYWPAFLMAANIKLPYKIYAHGWWTNEGQKISKSVGNIIDPYQEIKWLEGLGCDNDLAVDYFRYFLMKEVPFGNDGDYFQKSFTLRINAELANNIGNLAQRTLAMIYKNCDAKIPEINDKSLQEYLKNCQNFDKQIPDLIAQLKFDKALDKIIEFASVINKNLNDRAPWSLKKEGKITEMQDILYIAADAIRRLGIWLQPFMPKSAEKILNLLNIAEDKRNFANISDILPQDQMINQPKPIFLRLDLVLAGKQP